MSIFIIGCRIMAVAVLLAVLAGCGQRGPLYLPDDQPDSTTEEN